MISTRNLSALPDRKALKQLWKRLSLIEAILSPDWSDRYFSFNAHWSPNEMFGGMRDGSGDQMLVLFLENGCVINGLAHEYRQQEKDITTAGLPSAYHEFIFGEPVHSIGTTFCIWSDGADRWQIAQGIDKEDGSESLLWHLDGNPQTLVDWVEDYYEKEVPFEVVLEIYQDKPLTSQMVLSLNDEFDHWEQLTADLAEIEYPHTIS